MNTGGETMKMSGAAAPAARGGTIAKWTLRAVLGLIAVFGLGHLAISLAWLLVDPSARWRERSTENAVIVGAVLWVLLAATFTVTTRSSRLVRSAGALFVGSVFVVGLSQIPHTHGGLKPTCVIAHLDVTSFNPVILQAIGADVAVPPSMELLYSEEGWHHFRLADGRHAVVPRERVAALETCQERN